jgi:lysine biosynthesis protein LysW
VARCEFREGGKTVIRCPECAAEIDVDEDEVEEGEILNCPECESELEVTQVHPVHLILISDDLDDEEESEEPDEDDKKGDEEEEEDEDEEEKEVRGMPRCYSSGIRFSVWAV